VTDLSSSILGTRVLRVEDRRLVTEGGGYIADLDLPGALHVHYVRATEAHARIVGIDIADALAAPGVVGVFTAADLDDLPPAPPVLPMVPQDLTRPFLAADLVRFVGETVVAVVAETAAQAADASELVIVELDPLPVVVDPADALRGEVLLFPHAGTNVVFEIPAGTADGDPFAACDVVVEATMVNQRIAVAPLEPRAAAARWDAGRLTHWACTQGGHMTRTTIAARLGVTDDDVHVIVPDVGGGFGGKFGTYPEEILVAWLARRLDRPVRWAETRTENMLGFSHGRGQVQRARMGADSNGRVLAYELHVVQDVGAYPSSYGPLMPEMTRRMASGCYAFPTVRYSAQAVLTNTTPVGSFRGARRPEAAAAVERMIDLLAAELALDPVEIRRRNLLPPDAFPYTTPTGASYDTGDYETAMDKALAAAGYDELRAEQQRRRADGDPVLFGIGLSTYVEVTNPMGGGEFGAVAVHADGSATIRTGSSPHGQGHATAWAMLVHDATGIPMDRIRLVFGDTDLVPRGGGTGGSRSLQAGGSAVRLAAEEVVETARKIAADLLEAAPADVVLDAAGAGFHVIGAPAITRSWGEVAGAAPDPLAAEVDFVPDGATFPFGAHIAVVEVDTATGRVELTRFVAVDDAGRVLNPLLVEGQVHGGVASGVAQALYEEIRYDEAGNLLTANFADYAFVAASELPSFEVIEMETPTPRNPLGAKGIGESGTIGSTPAVQNAVVDALAHLGVRHVDLPLTPQRVWATLRGVGVAAATSA
jgi:aerobic carbon-monoxide dehydrogenase large subunit